MAIILVLLGMVTLLSIGILLLPVGMAMLVAAGYWGRPRLVVAITAAAVAFSAAYALTAPWSCTETTFLGEGSRVTRTCSRLALPDLPRFAQGRDYGEGVLRLRRRFWIFRERRLDLHWDISANKRTFDKIVELRDTIGLDYLMCAPLSHQSFMLFTEQVLPKLV